jgi:hypothetical protein
MKKSKILKNERVKTRKELRTSIKDLTDLKNFVTFYPYSSRKKEHLKSLNEWIKNKEDQLNNLL